MSAVAGIEKVLIANRGEIAVRVSRTLHRLGIRSAVVYHPAEGESAARRAADEAHALQGDSPVAAYLDAEQVVDAARRCGADALHPGYGFLSENADFAARVEAAGLRFVGPDSEVMRLLGDKIAARRLARERGFQVAPSAVEEEEPESFLERAAGIGFPLLIKASAGGGGRGMRVVTAEGELAEAAQRGRREAERYFGDGRIYAERYLPRPRHIEVQVLADAAGRCVHLFERECSIQRRFQKLIEETPAPGLDPVLRERLWEQAVGIARAAGYRGAGTVEFVLSDDGEFYFLEMNARLQVEHPVTECVTGIDLVEEQLRVAAGEPLRFAQEQIASRGVAIECRVCAEDPSRNFMPATGELLLLRPPEGAGLRFDGGVTAGQAVGADFDSLLAKLVAHGASRGEAIARARRGLREGVLLGVTTNAAFLERVLAHPAFAAGDLHTGFLSEHEGELGGGELAEPLRRALLAAVALADRDFCERVQAVPEPYSSMGRWRN